ISSGSGKLRQKIRRDPRMKKKTSLSEEDQALFRQLMVGTRKIKQDTIVHRPLRKKITEVPTRWLIEEQA
ncbi:hypothetical protein C9F02_00180, partial [Salmonella enterica subsp. enterica serovar Wilhelmsburg]